MSEHPGAPVGVVVVHGVGDPKPGETLDTLVESLCGRSPSLSIEATSRHVLTGSKYESEFVVPQRRLFDRRSGTTILMREVFWGDVGRVSESWWGSASAVGSLAMGLHALIFAGGGVSGRGGVRRRHLPRFTNESWWLRATFWTAFVGAYHIKGVLMPLAVALLTLGTFSMLVSSDSGPPPWGTLFVLPVAGILALFLPSPGARKDPPERWVVPTLAAGIWCVVGYVIPVCGVLIVTSTLRAANGWHVGLVFSVIFGLCHTVVILHTARVQWQCGLGRHAKCAAFFAAFIPWIPLTDRLAQLDDTTQVMRDLGGLLMSAYHLALGLAALWVFVIGACFSLCVFFRDAEHRDREANERDRGTVIFLGYAFEFSLWAAIATTMAWLARNLGDHERLIWLTVENTYGPRSWFPLVPVVFGISLAVLLVFWLWSNREKKPEIADLVGWPLAVVTIITAAACLVAVATALSCPLFGSPWRWLATVCAIILTCLVFVVRTFQEPLHHGLDLATDVTLYFRGRSWASSVQHRTDRLLKTRFRSVVNDLTPHVGRLVVVAHSQGTVIAVDALRRPTNVSQVDLLTMGSPLSSLYARFFPVGFGEFVRDARPKAKSWLNLYRKDDYVGRGLGGVNNQQIAGTGHEGYWTDPCVLKELERLIGL